MKTKYKKLYLPLGKVKGREFLARAMGCKGVGVSLMRLKPGEGASYVYHGTGCSHGLSCHGQHLETRRGIHGSRRDPAQKFSPRREDPPRRWHPQPKKDRALEKTVTIGKFVVFPL